MDSEFVSQFYDLATVFLKKSLLVIFIFTLFYLLAFAVRVSLRHLGDKMNEDRRYVFKIFAKFANIFILVLGVITSLATAGINVSALVASLGLTGFALGFACKDILSNILAGILVLIHKPFSRGDKITVSGRTGSVKSIELRYTTLTTEDSTILVPNSTLLSSVVIVQSS